MKIKFFLLITLAGILSSCLAPAPPSGQEPQVEEPPLPLAPETISGLNAARLASAGNLQPSAGVLTCKWAEDGIHFWLQDLHSAGLYSVLTLELADEFKGSEMTVLYDLSPDGKTAAYSEDGLEIKLFDVRLQTDRLTFLPDFPFSTAVFNHNGTVLGIQSLDEIRVLEISTQDGHQTANLSGFQTAAPVYTIRYSPDDETLLWWSRGTVQPMNVTTGEMGPVLSHEDFVAALAMSSDGRLIATAAAGTLEGEFLPLVTLWHSKAGSVIWQKSNPAYFSSLDFSPDGSLLAAGTEGEVIFYDTGTGDEVYRLETGAAVVNSLGFSPDGLVFLTCDTDGHAALWEPQGE